MSITYKDSGVDKEAGYQLVDKVKQVAKNTHNSNVLGGVGSFAALYALKDFKNPILVSGTDGVGTKLAVAFKQNLGHSERYALHTYQNYPEFKAQNLFKSGIDYFS